MSALSVHLCSFPLLILQYYIFYCVCVCVCVFLICFSQSLKADLKQIIFLKFAFTFTVFQITTQSLKYIFVGARTNGGTIFPSRLEKPLCWFLWPLG